MRSRLTPTARRAAILDAARNLFTERGYAGCEMEDIRAACALSRGGLYHHFANKSAVLAACVEQDCIGLAAHIEAAEGDALSALLDAASAHLGVGQGLFAAMKGAEEQLAFLAYLDAAMIRHIQPVLARRLAGALANDASADHLATLFCVVNAHINRQQALGLWDAPQAAGFAATALGALAPMLTDPAPLASRIARLRQVAVG